MPRKGQWRSKSSKVVRTPIPAAIRDVLAPARRARLFALYHDDGRLEFISTTSGKSVLTWFSADGHWTTTGSRRGTAIDPFQALEVAKEAERAFAFHRSPARGDIDDMDDHLRSIQRTS